MNALARGNDASLVELPREVWSRGSRPLQGRLLRWAVASAIVLLGLTFPILPVRIGAVAIAALVFFGLFPLVDSRLEALGKTLAASSRGEAAKLMSGLDERWMVSRFAPHAWVSAQKGRLNMIKGDVRAAAAAFAEAARQSGNAQQPDLVGSQAHALVLSGDPKGARLLLVGMEERKELRPLDAFNLGVAYVEEPGKTSRAVELLESARKDLGAAPRTDAALALAYARDGKIDESAALLEAMDPSDFGDDDIAKALHKRAGRSLRQATDSKAPKGKRKSSPAGTDATEGKPAKGKRDRRKDRREKRKARGGKKSRKGKREAGGDGLKEEASVVAKANERVPSGPAESTAAKSASETAAAEKAAAEKAAAEKAAAEKAQKAAAAEQAAADKVAAERKAAAAEQAAADKVAAERKAAAAEKAAADKAAADKVAADKVAADKVAADKVAAEKKAAAEKAAEEREARAKVVAETLARSAEEDSEEKARAEAESAARAAAERARERAEAKAKEGAAPEKPLFGSDSQPLFVPPPVPAFGSETGPRNGPSARKPVAPKLPAPPKVGPPKVSAPPVVDVAAKTPAIDTDGWEGLFGDD